MDGRMRAAVHCLEALRGVPTLEACHAAAILASVSLLDADECDDASLLLPAVPVAKNGSQLASAPMQRQQHGHPGAAVMERVAVLDLETTGPSPDLGDRPEAERRRQPAKADAARQVLARNFSSLFASVRLMAVGTGKVLEAERKAVRLPRTCIPLKLARPKARSRPSTSPTPPGR